MGCSKSKHKEVSVPWPLASHSRQEWIAWRSCFLTYMAEKYVPTYKQGNQFFEFIGNIGVEISKNFYYNNSSSESDIDTLLFKFDVYFIFGPRKRHSNESITDYIQALKNVAEKTAKSNIERVIKEKVIQDLQFEKIFEKFLKIMPSFSTIIDYESLALHELLFIWETCEKSEDNKSYLMSLEEINKDAFEDVKLETLCLQCDRHHENAKCPAVGQNCRKCGNLDHFAGCCMITYVKDCSYCGSNHIQGECPAFAKECSRCKKLNHFVWKCLTDVSVSCDFCGHNHINNMQDCPANNSICSNCNKQGHFSFKCHSRRNSKRKK